MEENQIMAIFRRELEAHEKNNALTIEKMVEGCTQEAIMQTFRILGIKMNEDGMESARADFRFLHQLRTAQEATKGIFFKTMFHMMVVGALLFLGSAILEKIVSTYQKAGGGS